jgi:hypothetical protein
MQPIMIKRSWRMVLTVKRIKTEKRNLKLSGFKIAEFKEEVFNVKSVN